MRGYFMPENGEVNCREAIVSQDYLDFIVRYTGSADEYAVQFPDAVCRQVINEKYMVIHVDASLVPNREQYTIAYQYVPKCYGLLDTLSLENTGVLRLRRQPYLNLLGEGVLLGFVDTGIDYLHPAFRTADGRTRIVSIWDQTVQTGNLPEGFLFGSEYTREQINEALAAEDPYGIVETRDTSGHGTFMAGIAAGSEVREADFSGVAPAADMAVVKLKQAKRYIRDYFFIGEDAECYQENDILLALRYLAQLAVRRNQPMIVCLGIGTNSGGHNGLSIVDEYLADISRSFGRAVSAAAGNEGNQGHHYRGGPVEGEYEEVELRVAEGEEGVFLELWASAPNVFTISLITPGGEAVSRIAPRIQESQQVTFLFEPTKVFIEYRILEPRTGDQLIVIRFQNPSSGIWRIRVYDEAGIGGLFDIWLPMEGFVNPETRFLRPDPEITICEPGNSGAVITTATYNDADNSLYLNSSRGYTRDGRIKPDIASPGVNVFGPVPGGGYARRTGSSIASAFTAGAAALILEWGPVRGNYPYMDSMEIKKLLIRGAVRSPLLHYPNPEWGYGRLNIYESFRSIRTAG